VRREKKLSKRLRKHTFNERRVGDLNSGNETYTREHISGNGGGGRSQLKKKKQGKSSKRSETNDGRGLQLSQKGGKTVGVMVKEEKKLGQWVGSEAEAWSSE